MPDPSLTPFGEEQCRRLAREFPYHDSIDLLVASPLRRTIFTTLLAFEPEIERGLQVIALPEVQETANVPCDTGTDIEILREEMKGKPVDLSRVEHGWNSKEDRWAPITSALEQRAREARQWLQKRPENHIVLVTHGGLLHYLTEDWTDYKPALGTGWKNVEYRSFQFADDDDASFDDDNASFVETEQSKKARKGTEIPLTETERIQLKQTIKKTKEDGRRHPMEAKV